MKLSVVFSRVKVLALALTACALGAAAAPAIVQVPLSAGANTGFADTRAEDRQGGWTDQGGNDLHMIKPGKLTAAGVPFEILDETSSGGKTCIVLGGPKREYLPLKASVPVAGLKGRSLYLLHAAAWCPPAKELKMTGVVFVDYADGSASEFHVRFGRDVGDWFSPESYKTAARAWTAAARGPTAAPLDGRA